MTTLTWNDHAIVSVAIDGTSYSSDTGAVTVDLKAGTHRADIHISQLTADKLRKKIRLNWLSSLCGSASYSMDDAFRDTFENVISFSFTVSDGDELIDIGGLMSSLPENMVTRTRQISAEKMKIVNLNLCLPIAILGGILTVVFGLLGGVVLRNGVSFGGVFASSVALLSAVITAWAIISVNIKMKRFCGEREKQ